VFDEGYNDARGEMHRSIGISVPVVAPRNRRQTMF